LKFFALLTIELVLSCIWSVIDPFLSCYTLFFLLTFSFYFFFSCREYEKVLLHQSNHSLVKFSNCTVSF
jgi:hypothetical protein